MKKLLVSLLCVMMMVTFMPAMAWANDADTNGTSCDVENCQHEASMGDKHYGKLQDAINAAESNASISLLRDVTLSEQLTISKPITLTGYKEMPNAVSDNYTLTINHDDTTYGNGGGILIKADGVELQNIVIVGPNENAMNGPSNGGWISNQHTIKVFGKDVRIKNALIKNGSEAIHVGANAELNLSGEIIFEDNCYNGIEIKNATQESGKVAGSVYIVSETKLSDNTIIWQEDAIDSTKRVRPNVTDNTNALFITENGATKNNAAIRISMDAPITVGDTLEFEITTTAGNLKGISVVGKGELKKDGVTISSESVKCQYYEVRDGKWYDYKDEYFGSSAGFPLTDATSNFRATFEEAGTYEFTFYVLDAATKKNTIATNTIEFSVIEKSVTPPVVTPPTEPDNVTNNNNPAGDKNTTADIKPTTPTTDGKVEATVDKETADKIVDKAVENGSTEVVIDAGSGSTTTADKVASAEVKVPTETMQNIVEKTEATVTIKTDAAEVTLDRQAVEAVATQAAAEKSETVVLVVEKTKDETEEMNFELSLVTESGKVSDFNGGKVSVTVKLNTTLKDHADENLVCVYIDDNGIYTKVEGKKNADGTYTFVTGHFSTYAIMSAEEADKIIKEQQIAAVKAFKITTKTELVKGKKMIIKWTVQGDESAIDGYRVYYSTKKADKGFKVLADVKGKKLNHTSIRTNKNIKKGTRVYYRVKAFKKMDGLRYLSEYSTAGQRTWK